MVKKESKKLADTIETTTDPKEDQYHKALIDLMDFVMGSRRYETANKNPYDIPEAQAVLKLLEVPDELSYADWKKEQAK